jgi:hypothetical protein
MRHHLNIIAAIYKFDKKDFTDFALKPENYNKHGILNENGFVTTSTMFSEGLVDSYKNHLEYKKFLDDKMKSLNEKIMENIDVFKRLANR